MAIPAALIWDKRLVWLAIAGWFLSLFLPVAYYGNRVVLEAAGDQLDVNLGYHVLMGGFLGPFMGQFGWYANIGFYICIDILLQNMVPSKRYAQIAVVTLLMLLNALFWREIPNANSSSSIDHFGPGYFLWILCVGGAAVLVLRRYRLGVRQENDK